MFKRHHVLSFAAGVAASTLPSAPARADDTAVIARYTTSGALDRSFHNDGKVSINFESTFGEGANAVALTSGGKIVIAGWAIPPTGGFNNHLFMVARLNSNGTLDTTFDGDGKVLTDFSSTSNEQIHAMAIDANGKIVVGGEADGQFALARYNTNGSLDTTFDGDGKVLTSFTSVQGESFIRGLTIAANGRIVVAGGAGAMQIALARYNTNGSLDTTFDGDGKVLTPVAERSAWAGDVRIDGNGKIVVAGSTATSTQGGDEMLVARYNTNGSLDTSYSTDGIALVNFTSTNQERANAILIDSSNRVIIGGQAGSQYALARTLANGNLDTSFGGDGKVVTEFFSRDYTEIFDLAFSGSKIVAVGSAELVAREDGDDEGMEFSGARYLSNGSLDTTLDGMVRS